MGAADGSARIGGGMTEQEKGSSSPFHWGEPEPTDPTAGEVPTMDEALERARPVGFLESCGLAALLLMAGGLAGVVGLAAVVGRLLGVA